MNDYSLYKSFEMKGSWWIPNEDAKSADKKAGTLTFAPDEGISLSLHGAFHDNLRKSSVVTIPIILGEASGQQLTLQDSITIHRSFGSEMTARESIVLVSRAFIGAHFHKPEQIRFEQISATLKHLGSWLWTIAFDIAYDWKNRKHTVIMTLPDPITVQLNSGAKVGIAYSSAGPTWDIPVGEITANVTPHFVYDASSNLEYYELSKELHHFQHFLTMAVGKPCHITSVQGMRSQEGAEEPAGAFERLVSVVYRPREALGQGRTIHPSEMVFTYDDIVQKPGQGAQVNWSKAHT